MGRTALIEQAVQQGTTRLVDPVTLEVIRYGLIAITDEVAVDFTRTAYSPLIYEYKDFCVALTDPCGAIIAQSLLPRFPGVEVQEALRVYGRACIQPGDVYLTNAPEVCGRHLNDVSLLTPAFNGDTLVGFVVIRAHWADIGGRDVGSCTTQHTTDIYQEGIQYPLVRLCRGGAVVDDVRRLILQNTRFRRPVEGDLNAQLAALLKARDLYEALVAKYTWPTVQAAVELIWRRSDEMARATLRAIPNGEYTAEAVMDTDGRPDGPPVPIRVRVVIHDEQMTLDLSGLGPQVAGSMNAGRYGGAWMAAKIAFKYVASPTDMINDGTFRALHVELPDGTFLSARPPAAMARYNAAIPTVIDTILHALAPALPERVAAGHHGSYGTYMFFGQQPTTGERYRHLDTAHGGWGGTGYHDGFSPLKTISHGDTQDIPVEVQEALFPLRVESYTFRQDSGGPGRFRGGLATERRYQVLHPSQLMANFDRQRCPPWGLFGGTHGTSGGVEVRSAPDEEPLWLTKATDQPLARGAAVTLRSGGGGGYGDPWERDVRLVERDVRYGYVSVEQARQHYGCIVDPATLALDEAASAQLRAGRRLATASAGEHGTQAAD